MVNMPLDKLPTPFQTRINPKDLGELIEIEKPAQS
jgi:hypothetical protein